MKLLSASSHGVLDYVVALFFFVGPHITGFTGPARSLAYAIGVVHILLSLITRMPLGVLKTLPFRLHGGVELLVAILLFALPWLANFAQGVHSRNFFWFMGLIVFVTWLVTDYRGAARRDAFDARNLHRP